MSAVTAQLGDCDRMMDTRESYEQCGAVPAPRRPEQRCRSKVRFLPSII